MCSIVIPVSVNIDSSDQTKKEYSIIYKLCRPAIIVGQVMGLISWDFVQPLLTHSKNYRLKRALIILYKLVAISFTIALFVASSKEDFEMTKNVTLFQKLALNASSLIPASFSVTVIIFFIFEANRFHNLLRMFENVENLLQGPTEKLKFRLKNIYPHFVLLLGSLMFCCVFLFESNISIVCTTFIIVQSSYEMFVSLFFSTTANFCAEGFSLFNGKLNEMLASLRTITSHCLEEIHLQHSQLHRLADSIQSAFSVAITGALGSMSFVLCLQLYKALNLSSNGLFAAVSLFHSAVLLHRMFTIFSASDNVTHQARLGLQTLNNIMPSKLSTSDGFQTIVLLSHKLNQNPPQFTAVGNLFRINMGTFTTIIGTIVTYLIVLIQFNPPVTNHVINVNVTTTN